MIKHQVNDYAGRRNVKPNRISEFDDSFVLFKLFGHGIKHRPQNERQNDERKPDVREQKQQIYESRRARAVKSVCGISAVINDVAN